MKLISAKCPNCNASIELNENLEKGICQYCGETVYVKEAIEKKKIELSGNVNVTIDNDTKKIKNIKNYLKLDELNNAKNLLDEVLESDPFNLDALELKVEIEYKELVDKYHLDESNDKLELSGVVYDNDLNNLESKLKKLINDLNKIKKIDDESKKSKTIEKYHSLYTNLLKEISKEKGNQEVDLKKDKKSSIIIIIAIVAFILLMIIFTGNDSSSENNKGTTLDDNAVKVYVFYGEDCSYCKKLHTYLSSLKETEIGSKFEVVDYEVWNSEENIQILDKVVSYFDTTNTGVPFTVIGDKYFKGYVDSLDQDIKDAINDAYDNNNFDIMDKIN